MSFCFPSLSFCWEKGRLLYQEKQWQRGVCGKPLELFQLSRSITHCGQMNKNQSDLQEENRCLFCLKTEIKHDAFKQITVCSSVMQRKKITNRRTILINRRCQAQDARAKWGLPHHFLWPVEASKMY